MQNQHVQILAKNVYILWGVIGIMTSSKAKSEIGAEKLK